MSKQDWSERLQAALDSKEPPSYELLQESVDGLLQQHEQLSSAMVDMSQKFGAILLARIKGDTPKVLELVDAIIAKHVELHPLPAQRH